MSTPARERRRAPRALADFPIQLTPGQGAAESKPVARIMGTDASGTPYPDPETFLAFTMYQN